MCPPDRAGITGAGDIAAAPAFSASLILFVDACRRASGQPVCAVTAWLGTFCG
jgi:hypothetical protein